MRARLARTGFVTGAVLFAGAGLMLLLGGARPQAQAGAAFRVPEADEARAAIGIEPDLSPEARALLEPAGDFAPIEMPGPHDWLASHPEPRESFAVYVQGGFLRPDEQRRRIALQPIGAFPPGAGPELEVLRAYTEAVFQLPTVVLPPADPAGMRLTERRNPDSGQRQLLSTDILAWLRSHLPPDAFCVLGITMVDLYPQDSWNYVFGQASPTQRVGVFSFARYDPAFFGEPAGPDAARKMLRRSLAVMVHETAHMFGLGHCVYHRCLINGSNHLVEADSRPLHLCPVCLHKLQYNVGFDLVAQHRALRAFYRQHGFDAEAEFIERRLQRAGVWRPAAQYRVVRRELPPERQAAMRGVSWREGCPVPLEDLVELELSHWGFDGRVHTGQLVVQRALADEVENIFDELFRARFPIERMDPIEAFGGDDDASMAADNTSAFNCRFAARRPGVFSLHSYGRAIDINPLRNPFLVKGEVLPPAGAAYADRSRTEPGMIRAGDAVHQAFTKRGWSWGGSWRSPDYQHFEKRP